MSGAFVSMLPLIIGAAVVSIVITISLIFGVLFLYKGITDLIG